MGEHRVLHLHGIPELREEASGLPRLQRRLVEAMRAHDFYAVLPGREVHVRSLEYHVYSDGGSVLDPQHRDTGSLLTLSVLLSEDRDFSGGVFFTWDGDQAREERVTSGDGIL